MARPTPPGKRTTPPGNRTRIGTLDIIIVIVGIIGIIGFNRLSIARLQRSLPNANMQIVGEWKAQYGPEHLIFRPDKSVSLILMPAAAQAAPAPAVPQPPAPSQTEAAAPAVPDASGAAPHVAPVAPAPVTGNYQLTEGGKIYIKLSNGKNYTTIIKPDNKNRFDLIDSDTEGVTTYERLS